jgi:hypothetical protein
MLPTYQDVALGINEPGMGNVSREETNVPPRSTSGRTAAMKAVAYLASIDY